MSLPIALTILHAAMVAQAVSVTAQPTATSVEIQFADIQANEGAVLFALFDSEGAYDFKGAPLRSAIAPVAAGTATTRIDGLAPGTYAVKAFHDVNGNGRMDTNPFGMPVEPFAFSNSAKGKMGPPSWSQARFEVTAGANRTAISFR